MLIQIKTLTGRKQGVQVNDDTCVLQLKEAIQEKEGITVDQIRLIYGGKQLADNNKLSEYKIEPGKCIHMVIQLRG